MNQTLNANALALAGAIVAAIGMLLLGIGANVGIYVGAAEQMAKWHMFFTFSFGGIVAGMIEAAIISYIFLYVLAWIYNRILSKD